METQMSVKIGTVELNVIETRITCDTQIKIEIEMQTPFEEKIWWQFVEMVATNQTITFNMDVSECEEWTCQCYIHTLECTEHNQNIMIISEVLEKYVDPIGNNKPKLFLDWNKIT